MDFQIFQSLFVRKMEEKLERVILLLQKIFYRFFQLVSNRRVHLYRQIKHSSVNISCIVSSSLLEDIYLFIFYHDLLNLLTTCKGPSTLT